MRRALLSAILSFAVGFSLTAGAQSKPAITRADYGQWESLSVGGGGGRGGGGGGGGFSPDGHWLSYSISRQNQTSELRLLKLADNTLKTIPFGSQLAFTTDSTWAGYSIGYSEAEQERMRTAQRPIQNKLALVNLTTGDTSTVDAIQSFAFSPDGAYVAMRLYSPAPPAAAPGAAPARGGGGGGGRGGGRGGGDNADEPVGASLIVRQLATGRDTTLGNIGEFAWQDAEHTHLLALAISADGKTGNGVQLFDPETTVLKVLESSPTAYTGLVWRKDATDLALFRAKTDAKKDGPSQAVLVWTGLGKADRLRVYDATADSTFPAGMRTVSFRRLSWSEDGNTLFLGIAKWDDAPVPAAGRGRGAAGAGPSTFPPPDEPATVDIWHWTDIAVSPRAKLSAAADRRRNLLAAWHLDTNKFLQLGKSYDESVTPMRHANTAYVAEWSAFAMDRTIGRPAADIYLEDMTTGARTKLRDNINDRDAQLGPAGKVLLYLQDDNFLTMNLATKAVTNITKGVPTSFIDKESDETVKQKPDFGVAGWTKDDAAVLLYDKFDIWRVPTDGTKATKLTDGTAEQVRHRLVRIGQDEEWIDLTKPVYVSLFGTLSKKSGYGVLRAAAAGGAGFSSTGLGAGSPPDRLLYLDKSIGSLAKAREADVYSYIQQDYDDSPDIFVGGPDLKTATQVTHTNDFQGKYAWGRSETVDFTTDKGMKLQGSLYYPAGYEAGKKYPMIVYLYEKLSDGVHGYVVPSDKSYYNITVFMSQGYFVFEPDIVFRPRQPGLSVVECVTAGVKKVAAMGPVDSKRVGVIGHSWGGFDTAFLATHTNGVFAGAVAGAPITDLVSNYGNHHWSSGIAETDHIETGQQRMEVPLYEDLPDYIANSAVFNASNMTVPLMIEVGDADGTVFWHQGIELYNIARRAKKNVVLLQYEGEDHGLRQPKNQIDYQRRILEWFGHYLKGDEAASWITKGTENR